MRNERLIFAGARSCIESTLLTGGAAYRMNPAGDVKNARERLIVALDVPTAAEAISLAERLNGEISFFKIGLQLYTAEGPEIVRRIRATGAHVFLDLKLFDIPNTVGKAVAAAAQLGVAMLTIHLAGGRRMLEAARASSPPDLLLLGVTVLTSFEEATLREIGVASSVEEQALRLARLGADAGIGGLIASPHELGALRTEFGEALKIVTPGVRPGWSSADDQKRFTTPAEALQRGADYLVIGRPITAHPQPEEAARRIIDEISAGH
jgi:orotidine-5'-phosphate decarboxylase